MKLSLLFAVLIVFALVVDNGDSFRRRKNRDRGRGDHRKWSDRSYDDLDEVEDSLDDIDRQLEDIDDELDSMDDSEFLPEDDDEDYFIPIDEDEYALPEEDDEGYPYDGKPEYYDDEPEYGDLGYGDGEPLEYEDDGCYDCYDESPGYFDDEEEPSSDAYRGSGSDYGDRGMMTGVGEDYDGTDDDDGYISPPSEDYDVATPEEIPSDYFPSDDLESPNADQPLNSVFDIQIPGFQIKIGYAHWWKARKNVCITKEIKSSTRPKTNFTFTSFQCFTAKVDAYVCNVQQSTKNTSMAYVLTYKCCNGFTRTVGDYGCPRKMSSDPNKARNFTDILRREFNFTSQLSKDFYLSSPMNNNSSSKLWTVFVPLVTSYANWTAEVLKKVDEKVVVDMSVDKEIMRFISSSRQILRNHFIANKSVPFSSLSNAIQLSTSAGSNLLRIKRSGAGVLINCVPVLRSDVAFNNFSIAHLVKSVIPMPTKTMYSYVLEKLEHLFSSKEKQQKVLEKVKARLMDANSASTLLLYIPKNVSLINEECITSMIMYGLLPDIHCDVCMKKTGFAFNMAGQRLRINSNVTDGSVYINGARISKSNIVATNGIIHVLESNIYRTEMGNILYNAISDLDKYKSIINASVSSTTSSKRVLLLVPTRRGTYNYTKLLSNTTQLSSIAGRVLSLNYSSGSSNLPMLSGENRTVSTIAQIQWTRTTYNTYVDCVKVKRIGNACDGTLLFYMQGPLPSNTDNYNLTSFLSSRSNYTLALKLVKKILQDNILNIRTMLSGGKLTFVLLSDSDLRTLTRGTDVETELEKVAFWYAELFIRSYDFCTLRLRQSRLLVREFVPARITCRGLYCVFHQARLVYKKAVVVLKETHAQVTEGAVIFAHVDG